MKTETVDDFDISALDAADEGVMTVFMRGKPTPWKWTFAGPGHPQTLALHERKHRERLKEERELFDARSHGEADPAADETLEQVRLRNVNNIVDRLIGWTSVKLDGAVLEFSADNARTVLLDERKGLYIQALRFIGNEASFYKADAKD